MDAAVSSLSKMHSLQKVESPALLRVWDDSGDPTLDDYRHDEDGHVARNHYPHLEDRMAQASLSHSLQIGLQVHISHFKMLLQIRGNPLRKCKWMPTWKTSVHTTAFSPPWNTGAHKLYIKIVNLDHRTVSIPQGGESWQPSDICGVNILQTSVQYRVQMTPVVTIPPHRSILATRKEEKRWHDMI